MKIAAIAALAGLGVASFLGKQEDVGPVSYADRARFLFHGVFEGLVEDGAQVELVEGILARKDEWFVPKCPICLSVHAAFRAYASYGRDNGWKSPRKDGLPPWFGAGLPKETMDALLSKEVETRHKAFEALVSKYVKARFEKVKMSDDARDRMQESLKIGMKEGLTNLKSSGDEKLFPVSCPSCEGAN